MNVLEYMSKWEDTDFENLHAGPGRYEPILDLCEKHKARLRRKDRRCVVHHLGELFAPFPMLELAGRVARILEVEEGYVVFVWANKLFNKLEEWQFADLQEWHDTVAARLPAKYMPWIMIRARLWMARNGLMGIRER
jgi:hypothetical protein